jgi:hypothetical protein
MEIKLQEIVGIPLMLVILVMISNPLINSNDVGLVEAGEYLRYLTCTIGAIWIGTIGLRLRR